MSILLKENAQPIKKILVAGHWHSLIHEEPLAKEFEKQGYDVVRFKWYKHFDVSNIRNVFQKYRIKLENKFVFGSTVANINKELLETVMHCKPDLVFIYRANVISKSTLKAITKYNENTKVVSYNNDDPFSRHYPWYTWLRFKHSISGYDLVFSYRPNNINNYIVHGAKKVEMLPPWYVKERNYPTTLSEAERKQYGCDVVFIGHFESDGRSELIRKLVVAGLKVGLYGPGWDKIVRFDNDLKHLYPVKYLHDGDYNKALCGASFALVLYSKLNNDVYTRRCFEIPATETAMLAKRTSEMEAFYTDNEEIIFFDNHEEAVKKICLLLKDKKRIKAIAKNGRLRANRSGYEIGPRAVGIINSVASLYDLDTTAKKSRNLLG